MKRCHFPLVCDVDIRACLQENLNAMGRLDEENAPNSHPNDVCVSVLRCVVKWSISIFVGGLDIRAAGQKFLRKKMCRVIASVFIY